MDASALTDDNCYDRTGDRGGVAVHGGAADRQGRAAALRHGGA